MKNLIKWAGAAAVSTVAVMLTATSVSAAVACNAAGECWHVKRAYTYQPGFGVVVHPTGWKWGPSEHFTWREHTGRGYWRNGVWVTF